MYWSITFLYILCAGIYITLYMCFITISPSSGSGALSFLTMLEYNACFTRSWHFLYMTNLPCGSRNS